MQRNIERRGTRVTGGRERRGAFQPTLLGTILLVGLLLGSGPATATPMEQGIQVHGHWKIEILEPDGTLVRSVEVENALSNHGKSYLARLLGRTTSVPLWRVVVTSNGETAPCEDQTIGAFECWILEPPWEVGTSEYSSDTLSVTVDSNNNLVLSGTIAANRGGTIDQVYTHAHDCSVTTAPSACTTYPPTGSESFSGTTISPISVANGQIIQVTVTLSFS